MLNISRSLRRRRAMEGVVGDPASKPPISCTLAKKEQSIEAMEKLMAKNLMAEAFHKARITLDKKGKPLVEHFFRHCIVKKRFKVLAELCLSDYEEQMVLHLLQQYGSPETDTVQLILLLQKNKYIEAVNFIEYVTAQRRGTNDTLNRIMSVYRSSMPAVTRSVADTYFRINSNLSMDSYTDKIFPLSCQMAQQNPSDIPSFLFSSLWTENFQDPKRLHRNLPFLRTLQQGSSELEQRYRTVCPVLLGERQTDKEERDKEPSSQCNRILRLEGNGGKDAETETDEIIVGIEEVAKPSSLSLQDGLTIPLSKEGVQEVSVGLKKLEIRVRRSVKCQHNGPAIRTMRLRSDDRKEAPPVTSRKRRLQKHNPVLETIMEEGSSDARSMTSVSMTPDPEMPIKGILSLSSSPSVVERSTPLRRSTRNSSKDTLPAVPSIPFDLKQPQLGCTTKRQRSELNDTNSSQNRELRPRRQTDSINPSSLASVTPRSIEDQLPPKKRIRAKK
ncbi:protein ELYS homolog isoform X2 [Drosophila serrata]|uniref:protein ELYS homolog isoform X2 n=1 Tax=Drosophila serrata TaxID=7274 RepID=UPI000A1CF63A|nr:protein ELYS homolog isoform X2 [Drosophila serrata]